MALSDKISIRLELSKDKDDKLSIIVRFNGKASNFTIDKNECTWIPTIEEKQLIDEAFKLILDEKTPVPPPPITRPIRFEDQLREPKVEKIEIKKDGSLEAKIDVKLEERSKTEQPSKQEIEEKSTIVEVGDESLEDAIEKHIKKDEPLKEADEHTIIDRVLSQKKKGRWKKI